MNWRFWERKEEAPLPAFLKPAPQAAPTPDMFQAEPVNVSAPEPEPSTADGDRMDPEIKKRWVEALRSGKYEQGKHKLRARKDHEKTRYCCLGVLCEIAVQDGIIDPPNRVAGGVYEYDKSHSLPSIKVSEWAGLDDCNPAVRTSWGAWVSLAEWNDDGASFAEIADVIEKQL